MSPSIRASRCGASPSASTLRAPSTVSDRLALMAEYVADSRR